MSTTEANVTASTEAYTGQEMATCKMNRHYTNAM